MCASQIATIGKVGCAIATPANASANGASVECAAL
jgi:hypothetical protein